MVAVELKDANQNVEIWDGARGVGRMDSVVPRRM